MAFRTGLVPAEALLEAKRVSSQIKLRAQQKSTEFQSTTNRDVVLALSRDLSVVRARLATLAATPGLAQYARDQENDQAYDVVTEFNNMVAAIDAAISQIVSTFPTSANGFVEESTLGANGRTTVGTFGPAALATLRTRLDEIAASITV